jgi:hypothetical protein
MESLLSKLLASYESGSVSRRDLIRAMAMLVATTEAAAAEASAAPGFQSLHLEHVSITTENPQKSADWWKDALNLHQRPNQPDGAIRLGLEGKDRTLIVFRTAKVTNIVDHFAMAIDPFQRTVLLEDFKRRNIPTSTDGEFLIKDPNGIYCQLMDDRSKR